MVCSNFWWYSLEPACSTKHLSQPLSYKFDGICSHETFIFCLNWNTELKITHFVFKTFKSCSNLQTFLKCCWVYWHRQKKGLALEVNFRPSYMFLIQVLSEYSLLPFISFFGGFVISNIVMILYILDETACCSAICNFNYINKIFYWLAC
jgi:hypothetical protein